MRQLFPLAVDADADPSYSCSIGGYFYVPETRRRTYEELDEMFMDKIAARQFKKHVTVAETRAHEALDIVEHKEGRAGSV